MQHATVSPVITSFHEKYRDSEHRYYEKLAELVYRICKMNLKRYECEAHITYRAKPADSLLDKLIERDKPYTNHNEIREDIVDLSGVRIALFFPHHKENVKTFLEQDFSVTELKSHPDRVRKGRTGVNANERSKAKFPSGYECRFPGYTATHFRVELLEKDRELSFNQDPKAEIQVMTVLQCAWSEVEHNMIYKKLKGEPSIEECRVLDGLNGLVAIGEMYLEQLNTIFEARIASEKNNQEPFDDKHELGYFVSSQMRRRWNKDKFVLSSVDLLRKFLELTDVQCNTKQSLEPKIEQIKTEADLRTCFKSSTREKPNVTLILMDNLYFGPESQLRANARNQTVSTTEDRCKILLSTIISLDELFHPPSLWETELIGRAEEGSRATEDRLECLKWLIRNQAPRNIIFGYADTLDDEESSMLTELWNWFNDHPSRNVEFTFGISKLGVQRDFPRDLRLLDKIFHASQAWKGTD